MGQINEQGMLGSAPVPPSQQVSLNDHADGVLSLRPANGPSYTSDHVDDMSSKYDAVLGPASPGLAAIQSSLSTNGQDRLATIMKTNQDLVLERARSQIAQSLIDQAQGDVTPELLDTIRNLSTADLTSGDIGSILEDRYAKTMINVGLDKANNQTGMYDNSILTDAELTSQVLDLAERATSRNVISNNIMNDLKSKYDSSNILIKGQAFLQQLVPGRSWFAMNTALDKDMPDYLKNALSILPGNSMRDQITYLHTLPPAEYKRVLQGVVDRMVGQGDYLDAMQFVEATLSFGSDDQNWQNIFAGLDAASVVPVGKVAKLLKGVSASVKLPIRDAEAITRMMKFEGESSSIALGRALEQGVLPSLDIRKVPDIERALIGTQRPAEFFSGVPARTSAEVLSRLETAAQRRASAASVILTGVNKVGRATPAEIAQAVEITKAEMRKQFVDQNHHIIRFDPVNEPDNLSNIYNVTMVLGKKDGSVFPSKLTAQAWAGKQLKLRTNDFIVKEEGAGYVIKITRNVDESRGGISRNFDIETDSKSADNMWTRFKSLSFIFGADTRMGKSQQIARSTVVTSAEKMNQLLQEFAKPMSALAVNDKKGYKELDKFLTRARDHVDPERGRGITYETQADFESAFQAQFGKLPTEGQSDAYHAFKTYYDMDTVVRSFDVYRQKAILGVEKFSVDRRIYEVDKNTNKLTDTVKYGGEINFEGKAVPELPRGKPFRAVVLNSDGIVEKGNNLNWRYMKEADYERVQKYLDDGYTIVQPYEGYVKLNAGLPGSAEDAAEQTFDFVIMKNFRRDRPDLNLVNSRNRMVQRYPFWVKQPHVETDKYGTYRYYFDRTVANARDSVDAAEIADKFNRVRLAEKSARGAGQALFEDAFPMWDYKDFSKAIDDGEVKLDIPFMDTRAGSRTIDQHDVLRRLTDEGHTVHNFDKGDNFRLSNLVNGRFLNEPDMLHSTLASEQGTLFELSTDSFMSPFEAMKISMNDLTNVNVMNDYKIRSARDYVQQFGHLLDHQPGDFQTNGLKFILEPKYLRNADPGEVASAEAIRKSILSMWNHTTVVDRIVTGYKERLIRSLRDKFGDGVAEWVDDKALPAIQGTDQFLRGFAFHTKMGFFNPKQLFLQASTVANVWAIAGPKNGSRALMLMTPLRAGLYASSDELLKGIGAKLSKTMGITPEQYVELVQAYRRSGFDMVGNDFAYIEDLKPPGWTTNKFVKGANKILDAGRTPFNFGERITRSAAFAAAYLERSGTIGAKALSRDDEAWILWRAKALTGSMSKESTSVMQKGWSGVVTQFFGYQMRLMEQMLGIDGKLTVGERARLFGMMGFLYGVPVAASMTIGVAPLRTMLKDWMAENNIDTTNTAFDPFIDGFASTFIKMLTGSEFNVSERYGPNGINTFYDLIKGDATMTDLLAGAGGGLMWDTLVTYDPIMKWFGASMRAGDVTSYQITAQDWMDVAQQITTVNNAVKIWNAINLGKWITRNQNVLTDVKPLEALISGVLGVDPERVSDMFNQITAMDNIKQKQQDAMSEMVKDYRKGIQAVRAGDKNLAATLFNRVKVTGHLNGLTLHQFSQVYNRALNGEPLDEATLRNYGKIFGENF